MDRIFRPSHFTAVIPGEDGELLLVNSFMGALARVAAPYAEEVAGAVANGVREGELSEDLEFLLSGGYLVEEGTDELPIVREILRRERAENGQELIIMPHENCNFRCVYCYETFVRNKMAPEIVEGAKRLVAQRAGEWGRVHVSWFGGEPLLARDVLLDLSDSFLASCADAGVGFSAAMTTNAYLLGPELARDLCDRECRFFQITVDGPASEHDRRRHLVSGRGTYERVLSNLVALRESDLDVTVRLRVNYDPASLPAITPWVADELAPLFAGDERFHLAFHPIGRWGGPNDAELAVCSEQDGWRVRNELYERSVDAGFPPQSFRSFLASHGSTCYAGRESSIVIGSDGRLYKCTVAFDDPRNHVGWLRADGTLDIEQDKFRRWVSTGHLDTAKCDSCWFHAACQSRACPLVAMEDGTPPCPTQRDEMRELVQITAYGGRLPSA